MELLYGNAREDMLRTERDVCLDAHDFLDYAALRGQVAELILRLFRSRADAAMIGFLTGSLGPTVETREFAGQHWPGRSFVCGGLAHSAPGQGIEDAEQHFHQTLSRLVEADRRHFVLVDELVSGSAVRTAMKSARRWMDSAGLNEVTFEVVGVYETPRDPKHDSLEKLHAAMMRGYLPEGRVTAATWLQTRRLLEKDTDGLCFRSFTFDKETSAYTIVRESPRSVRLDCPANGMVHYYCPCGSADQPFGGHVRAVLGIGRAETADRQIRENITNNGCDDCRRFLALASEQGARLQAGLPVA